MVTCNGDFNQQALHEAEAVKRWCTVRNYADKCDYVADVQRRKAQERCHVREGLIEVICIATVLALCFMHETGLVDTVQKRSRRRNQKTGMHTKESLGFRIMTACNTDLPYT